MPLKTFALAVAVLLGAAAAARAERVRVNAPRANLRAEATLSSQVLSALPTGTVLEVLERSGEWYKVKVVGSGAVGFVHGSVVEAAPEPPPAPAASPAAAAPTPPDTPATPVTPKPEAPAAKPAPAPQAPTRAAAPRAAPRPPAPPAGETRPKIALILNGVFGLSLDYTDNRTIHEFAEDGTIDTTYSEKSGPGADLGIRYGFSDRFAVVASFSYLDRSGSGAVSARLPHPLYLNAHRQVSLDLHDTKYQESAIHVDLAYTGHSGSLDYALFAGPTFFMVSADLLDTLQTREAYPFDTVTITGTPTRSVSKSVVGFNVGAGLDYRLGPRFGLGAQVRFSRGSAKLAPAEGDEVSVDAGGFQAAAGARIYF